MTVIIPGNVLRLGRLDEAEVKVELALALFQQDRLTLGQAAELGNCRNSIFSGYLGVGKSPYTTDLSNWNMI